jgi:hypothetical protein
LFVHRAISILSKRRYSLCYHKNTYFSREKQVYLKNPCQPSKL